MQVSTPLAEDVLLFQRAHVWEELSRPFEHQFTLLSTQKDINLDEVLGKPISLQLALPNNKTRYFSGYITRFSQGGMFGRYYRYTATSRPWLWFLTRTSDCRIFQEMTVPDIIKKVFADHPTADVDYKLSASYRKWTYCVQYRETDFNFVSRLMEQEGIYYYFRHDQGRHTLVLVDSTSAHKPYGDYSTIAYLSPERQQRTDQEYIDSWDLAREIQPGVYAQDDFDFERPSAELLTKKNVSRKHAVADYEVYDFPGEYLQKGDGDHYASVRMDELSTQFEVARGTTNARGLTVGATFTLSDQTRDDQNREYLIVNATYELEYSNYEGLTKPIPGDYHCSFGAITTRQQFRPVRLTPKPHVMGPQTAVVVGPSGDEIFTDKYGRVKVQFPWDRYGKKNENSSCWLRVSHPWAGKNWGMIAIPRIGQEVIVDFLEGDPDEPIITGRVYNAEQMPPYALPANMTQTGTKTRSSKGGDPSNFNEIRFEDKKGSEQLFVHAEKNHDIEVENDETHWVGHDRTRRVDNDETVEVKRDLSFTVDRNKTLHVVGNHSENIDGAMSITVSKTLTESVLINYSETVGGAMELTVGAAMTMTVGGALAETVGAAKAESIGGSKTENIGDNKTISVGKDLKQIVEGQQSLEVKKDLTESVEGKYSCEVKDKLWFKAKAVQIDADDQINLKAGSAEIIMKSNGDITINGGKITINASGDLVLKGSKIAEN
jgi:type VI secretion system secreted protein VgrG